MNQSIEIEFKNILTKEEFTKLLNYFQIKSSQFFVQENHYFDTNSFYLKQNKMALRVREKNGNFELTLKQPTTTIGLLESTEQISYNQFNQLKEGSFPKGEINKLLTPFVDNTNEIRFFGTLKTYRFELPYKNGLLVLDHSIYLDTEDYEIEYEVTNEEEGWLYFQQLLIQLGIEKRNTPNKIMRLIMRKQLLMKGE